MSALLAAAGHVLEMKDFNTTARTIFDIARELTGATSGYVALLNEQGNENEVLFLEAGGMPCSVDPSLPMPIRGLRAESYASGKAVACNDFMHSEWVKMMPHGHVVLRNVMFAPLNIGGLTVGLRDGQLDEILQQRSAHATAWAFTVACKSLKGKP
jgi:GAF domain-containing protein